jgi:hypothetical protein
MKIYSDGKDVDGGIRDGTRSRCTVELYYTAVVEN